VISDRGVERLIVAVRGQRVILDADLARLYGVETKALNRAVKRNAERFPADFMFQVTSEELGDVRYQYGTSNRELRNWSQIATTGGKRGGRRYRPYAFTEHGALQAANILRSTRAVQMSVFVIRAFVKMREQLMANAAIHKRLAEIDQTRLLHDSALRDL